MLLGLRVLCDKQHYLFSYIHIFLFGVMS